jgi:hypothetical protein
MSFPPSEDEVRRVLEEAEENHRLGVGQPAPSPSHFETEQEKLEVLLANLFIMQVMAVAKIDALYEVLHAKQYITDEEMEAINRDVIAVVNARAEGQ